MVIKSLVVVVAVVVAIAAEAESEVVIVIAVAVVIVVVYSRPITSSKLEDGNAREGIVCEGVEMATPDEISLKRLCE